MDDKPASSSSVVLHWAGDCLCPFLRRSVTFCISAMWCIKQSISCCSQCVHAKADNAILFNVLWIQLAFLDGYLTREWRATLTWSVWDLDLLEPSLKNGLDGGKELLIQRCQSMTYRMDTWVMSLNIFPLQANSIYLCRYFFIASNHKNSACTLNKHDPLISALLYHASAMAQIFLFGFKSLKGKTCIRTKVRSCSNLSVIWLWHCRVYRINWVVTQSLVLFWKCSYLPFCPLGTPHHSPKVRKLLHCFFHPPFQFGVSISTQIFRTQYLNKMLVIWLT